MARGRTFPKPMGMLSVMCLFALTTAAEGRLRIESQQLDLGEVKAGTAAVATFVFHNDGDRDITILRATPS